MTDFTVMPPSPGWQPLPLDPAGRFAAWMWIKPQGLPHGVTVSIPDPLWRLPGAAGLLTYRGVATAIRLPLDTWKQVGVGGRMVPITAAFNWDATLDQAQLLTTGGMLSFIARVESPAPAMTQTGTASASSSSSVENAGGLLHRMHEDWKAIVALERQLAQLRKQLQSKLGRLESLDRDLNAEEGSHADSGQKREWQATRRLLRDAGTVCSRYMREYDMGLTSMAGQRAHFEQMVQQYIEPKKPFDGMDRFKFDLENYRKTFQNLATSMQVALNQKGGSAEQKAVRILNEIAATVRAARHKR